MGRSKSVNTDIYEMPISKSMINSDSREQLRTRKINIVADERASSYIDKIEDYLPVTG